MKARKHWLKVIAASVLAALTAPVSPLHAEPWPQRGVRLVVPIGAGSSTDVAARIYADRLAARWKQPVVVENRPGADGLIGTTAFVGAHDDHALLFSFASPMSVLPVIHANLPYDPGRDLVPISLAADTFGTLTAHASLKVGSLKDLVALARSQPGKLNYIGQGAFPYLLAGFFKSEHIDVVAVSYREFNLGIQDHAQGRVHLAMTAMTSQLPLVQSGHINFLVVTNSKRSPMIPDVPTATESGFPELAFEGLTGFFGSRAMSAELTDRISRDIRAVAVEPVVAERFAAVGQIARGTTPAEFAEMIEAQRAKIATIVQETGMKTSR
jgi:tripartite-type tricarboxylate transporter receptor subunit TctC